MSTFEVTLTGAAYGGEAVGRLPDGRAVFVSFGIPGEIVRVRLVEQKPRFARGEIIEFIEPSPDRIVPRCSHFSVCGGCHYQHMTYVRQLALKSAILREQLERIGRLAEPPLGPIVPSPRPFYYRNHLRFQLTPDGGLGFFKFRSGEILPINECHLPDPGINDIWPQMDLDAIPGMERVGLRLGSEGDVLMVFESSNPDPPEFSVEGLDVSTIFQGSGGPAVLAGNAHTSIRIKEKPFRVSAGSFFQVNSDLVPAMVDEVLRCAAESKPGLLLEVYAGVGLFSAFLAPQIERLVAVEADPGASEDFAFNLDEFDHVELYQGDAEEILPWLEISPDVILVDPPRVGLGHDVLKRIIKFSPGAIIYVSCDPATLARDGRQLVEAGYRLVRITPFDMFPQTYHIESISLWVRG